VTVKFIVRHNHHEFQIGLVPQLNNTLFQTSRNVQTPAATFINNIVSHNSHWLFIRTTCTETKKRSPRKVEVVGGGWGQQGQQRQVDLPGAQRPGLCPPVRTTARRRAL